MARTPLQYLHRSALKTRRTRKRECFWKSIAKTSFLKNWVEQGCTSRLSLQMVAEGGQPRKLFLTTLDNVHCKGPGLQLTLCTSPLFARTCSLETAFFTPFFTPAAPPRLARPGGHPARAQGNHVVVRSLLGSTREDWDQATNQINQINRSIQPIHQIDQTKSIQYPNNPSQ